MAWSYFAICLSDFILFPIAAAIHQAIWEIPYEQWQPLTLKGGGLYHIAMGTIIGVTSWQRSQERIAFYREDSYSRYRRYDDDEDDEDDDDLRTSRRRGRSYEYTGDTVEAQPGYSNRAD